MYNADHNLTTVYTAPHIRDSLSDNVSFPNPLNDRRYVIFQTRIFPQTLTMQFKYQDQT
jgi:hypothetical protein